MPHMFEGNTWIYTCMLGVMMPYMFSRIIRCLGLHVMHQYNDYVWTLHVSIAFLHVIVLACECTLAIGRWGEKFNVGIYNPR
jgi:hypothetical protein